jgi:hypothetical protein
MKNIKAFFFGLALFVASFGAHALDLTNFAENRIIDALLRGQALSPPATWHIALDTASCTESGGGTEVTGGSYARAPLAASLANWAGTQGAGTTVASSGTGGTSSNNVVISFPTPTVSWGTVVSMRWMDASSGGNAWICTQLVQSKVVNIGDIVSFPIGALTFQIDN